MISNAILLYIFLVFSFPCRRSINPAALKDFRETPTNNSKGKTNIERNSSHSNKQSHPFQISMGTSSFLGKYCLPPSLPPS